MTFKKQAKRAQAAIEFLMTYGWMLLVVLIVGALIFSFVDFGSLLPSTVEFSSSAVRGDSQASAAYNRDFPINGDDVYVAFTYTGTNRASFNATGVNLSSEIDSSEWCSVSGLTNDDTQGTIAATPAGVPFLNGQRGSILFNCSSFNGGNGLIEGDALEADIIISYVDSRRQGRLIPNTGSVRLPIQ